MSHQFLRLNNQRLKALHGEYLPASYIEGISVVLIVEQ